MSPLVGKIKIDTWVLVVQRIFHMHRLGHFFFFKLKNNLETSTITSFT